MNISERKKELIIELSNKEYRDAYVKASVNIGVPSQILALREQRKWTQEELGKHAQMAQESISRIEDPTSGSVNLKTLMRLASAFDVALMVQFVPFSHLINWKLSLSTEALEAKSFDNDTFFDTEAEDLSADTLKQLTNLPVTYIAGNLIGVNFSPSASASNAISRLSDDSYSALTA